MNIIQENRIFDKFFKKISKSFIREDIEEIIVHGTGGGVSASAIINWMLGGERKAEYERGIALFHYEIDRNGDVYQIISPKYWCYHSSSGRHDKKTIGIELVNPIKENHGSYMIQQYNSLCNLIKMFMTTYDLKVIAGHGATKQKYSGGYKNCPGEKFEWSILENNFNLEKESGERYRML
jgi:N-acetyl-anhydromuramyl-L-alanine amidase AmpD